MLLSLVCRRAQVGLATGPGSEALSAVLCRREAQLADMHGRSDRMPFACAGKLLAEDPAARRLGFHMHPDSSDNSARAGGAGGVLVSIERLSQTAILSAHGQQALIT